MNVVLIVCDTLRADHLGCYGDGRPISPWIDRLANEGTLYTAVLSPHIPTEPAHTTLFSGQDVFAHRVVAHGGSVEPPHGLAWMPELLRQSGVRCVAVDNLGRWIARGFDMYERFRLSPRADGTWPKADIVLEAAARAIPCLQETRENGQPFFSFFHLWDPHTPYVPRAPFDRLFYEGDPRRAGEHGLDAMWAFSPFSEYFAGWLAGVTDRAFPRAQYAACVRELDDGVERLFGLLREAGCLRDTMVILVGDHGEELGEHGIWFDHHGLYHTNLHVPLILWAPGTVPSGRSIDHPATLLDVAPTILQVMGVSPAAVMKGQNLLSLGAQVPGPVYCTECTWMKKRAWCSGGWKLISALEPDFHGQPDLELYDLISDPGETCNLAAVRPERLATMLAELEAHVAARLAATGEPDPLREQPVASRRIGPPPVAQPSVTDKEREAVSRRLENLGY